MIARPRSVSLVLVVAALGCRKADKPAPPAPASTASVSAAPAATASAAAVPFAGQVRLGKPQVVGRIKPEIVDRVVRKGFDSIRLCYADALKEDPTTGGRLVVQFTIDKVGNVKNSVPGQTTLATGGLPDCVARAIEDLTFPAEGVEVKVAYPITFSPS